MADPADDCLVAAEHAVELVARWVGAAAELQTAEERRTADRLDGVVADPDGVAFAMAFVDRVIRAEDPVVAAGQLAHLVRGRPLPAFLSTVDRLLLRAGARLAPLLPRVVVPLAQRRLRQLVGHLVVDAEIAGLRKHLAARRGAGFGLNVNLLGEAVLGEREAQRRYDEALRLLDEPDVDYVSVKLSALVPHLNYWDYDGCVEKVSERLRSLFEHAAHTAPPTFVNLDMEEYHDLELTLTAFMAVLDEPPRRGVSAGIVLQAYLPDSFEALQKLVAWASARRTAAGEGAAGEIKVRLVKGANLAMERVEAAIHGWEQAPYDTKAETDANYKRCLDWLLTPEHTAAVRVGVASHNLFDVAWSLALADRRGVSDRVEVEMLEGMAPTHARLLGQRGRHPLLYTPVVAAADFDVAISYLFRRLEENSSEENFIHHLFGLRPGTAAFAAEAEKFRRAVAARAEVASGPHRTQDRTAPEPGVDPGAPFRNEPDSDPALPAVRAWARDVVTGPLPGALPEMVDAVDAVDAAVARARNAQTSWAARSTADRQAVLHAVADELARRRGDLIAVMVHEGRKTFGQADPEVSEAVDFARWYGDRARDLDRSDGASFEPLGVITVAPPWNFPVAIPAGGVLAALAAGNSVILKPAPEVPRCAAIVAECCWAAGVPTDVLQLVRAPDTEVGQRLITHPHVDAVILTGGYETADLFRSWRPDLRLFAETSGKNALVITPSADIDLAVADLVASAFGHSGQKCSAASLAICVGQAYESPRLRRQLVDAVTSLEVGGPTDLASDTGPLIGRPTGKLARALGDPDPGEDWLVEPQRIADDVWRPGVRLGVRPESWFHTTECFGPVLGLMHAATLDDAIEMQNATPFGLTGGIHSLDTAETERWVDDVQVGNAYVNRGTTGAIVRRQPFGGWKRSVIGPGAKAGGPNYVARLGTWRPVDEQRDGDWLAAAERSDQRAWAEEFGVEHDPTGLFCESNVFRYRPLAAIAVRAEAGADETELARVRAAARRCGVAVVESGALTESAEAFAARLPSLGVDRVRVLGPVDSALRAAANDHNLHVADDPVTRDGRIELQHYVREQAVSTTLHRYGNLIT
ncbi:MAG: bifunctional proline dehydrogenase/L-glutamate gamma-semialdehyde dehydrogenase [Acidimicrobiales bacterium]|nr:bifunctional proline dehydrogenase/L-glutamate gamma-semialdehyde dehydrogenase [Acidimicrobiales bacterium]